jgi:hypothetical protein
VKAELGGSVTQASATSGCVVPDARGRFLGISVPDLPWLRPQDCKHLWASTPNQTMHLVVKCERCGEVRVNDTFPHPSCPVTESPCDRPGCSSGCEKLEDERDGSLVE